MKKIINGKVYDTETAQEVGAWDNNMSHRDVCWCSETLYRKKTGEYFIHGKGGPASRYAEAVGSNGWRFGERIMPLTYKWATEWAEKHLDCDEYEQIFGKVTEDETRKTAAYSLSVTAIEVLRRMAQAQGRPASEILDELILANK